MDKIQQSAEYYQLLVDRMEKSGQSQHQVKIYKELTQLVLSCISIEEVQEKMKKEGYYESPSQALYMDKMTSLENAAKQNDFTELALIYRERIDEVQADFLKMYETGYNNKVLAFFTKLSGELSAFYEIYSNYLTHKTANIFDHSYKISLDSIRENQKNLNELGTDFKSISIKKYFRDHIILDDAAYSEFVSETESLFQKFNYDPMEEQSVRNLGDEAWAILKDKKSEVQEIDKSENARSKRSVFMAAPPEDVNGKYEFLFNEQEER